MRQWGLVLAVAALWEKQSGKEFTKRERSSSPLMSVAISVLEDEVTHLAVGSILETHSTCGNKPPSYRGRVEDVRDPREKCPSFEQRAYSLLTQLAEVETQPERIWSH